MEGVNPKFKNPELYMKAKKEVTTKYKKHSAYRSMMIVKKYKELGGKIDSTKKTKSGLTRWKLENWKNLTPVALGLTSIANAPKCGVKHAKQGNNKSICRPTVKKGKNTPKLAQTYTKEEIKKAQKLKNLGLRIEWSEL